MHSPMMRNQISTHFSPVRSFVYACSEASISQARALFCCLLARTSKGPWWLLPQKLRPSFIKSPSHRRYVPAGHSGPIRGPVLLPRLRAAGMYLPHVLRYVSLPGVRVHLGSSPSLSFLFFLFSLYRVIPHYSYLGITVLPCAVSPRAGLSSLRPLGRSESRGTVSVMTPPAGCYSVGTRLCQGFCLRQTRLRTGYFYLREASPFNEGSN